MTMKAFIAAFAVLCILTCVESFFEQIPFFNKKPRLSPPGNKKTRQQIRKELGGLPEAHELTTKQKQQYVYDAFVFSWEGYKNYSWGYDENRPVQNKPRNTR